MEYDPEIFSLLGEKVSWLKISVSSVKMDELRILLDI